jgi:hypothetical protein
MKIKTIGCICITIAAPIIGGIIGRYTALDRNYRIEREQGQVMLRSADPNQAYPLTILDGQIYLGDSEHNLIGVRKLSKYEGQQSMQPTVDTLAETNSELEGRIKARQITDTIEEVGDDLRDAWRNFKHNLIE